MRLFEQPGGRYPARAAPAIRNGRGILAMRPGPRLRRAAPQLNNRLWRITELTNSRSIASHCPSITGNPDMALEALIFDVDGTLADNERDGHRVAFNQAFAEAGLNWEWDVPTYDRLLEVFGGKERLRFYIEHDHPDFNPPGGLDTFVRNLHREKTRCYTELLKSGALPLRCGVERLLREARAEGLRLAVASTTTPENVTVLLEQTVGPDAVAWFDVIAAGDMAERKKPAPDVYLLALDLLGLDPANCLALEDTEAGLASARAAGLGTLITVNGATRHQDFTGALLVVDQLGDPGKPTKVLAGDAVGARLVDVALLRRLHREALGG